MDDEKKVAIAVDAVLLPSDEVADEAIRINRELLKNTESDYVLTPTDRIPHLSLVMGSLRPKSIPEVSRLLQEIASITPPIELYFSGIGVRINPIGEPIATLTVERAAALRSLHEEISRALSPHLAEDAAAEGFIGYPDVKPSSVAWVKDYRIAASFERFSPHITLGIGRPDTSISPLRQGRAERLALCHLGNYCTCRKVLFEGRLKGSL
jgi:2'-5' RNA ligase